MGVFSERLAILPDTPKAVAARIIPKADFAGNVAVVTLGCAKNQVDSEVMLGAFQGKGYRVVTDPKNAEVIVVNTCAFLESAVSEGIDTILELARYKKEGRLRKLIVAGCMVERYRGELQKEFPEVDRFLSTDELLQVADDQSTTAECFDGARRPYFLYDETMPRVINQGGTPFSYVKIAEGCDRPCSFCIIPKIRGTFRSRPLQSVTTEIQELVAMGTKEINLVAQDLTAYGSDFPGNRAYQSQLPKLLDEISKLSGDYWVRLLYAYPIGVTEELIQKISAIPQICNYLDLPLQHISGNVLKAMRRPLGERGTRQLIEKIKTLAPQIALRTTFIVGFPGETEEDVDRLEEFVRSGFFFHVGVFTYSQEAEAVSYHYSDQVPEELKNERRARVMEAQQEMVQRQLRSFVGRQLKVLLEGDHVETDLLLTARAEFQAPETDGEIIINEIDEDTLDENEENGSSRAELKGKFSTVEITDVAGYDLVGTLID